MLQFAPQRDVLQPAQPLSKSLSSRRSCPKESFLESANKQLDESKMEQTSRPRRITLRMGVFMTASEANRERVFRLLIVEREQMRAQFPPEDKESPAMKRSKPPMSETRQPWICGPSNRIQSIAS